MNRLAILVFLGLLAGCSSPSQTYDPVEITVDELEPAAPGVPYAVTLSATGGDGAYVWAVESGALPVGLTLTSSGELSGVPTTTEVAFFSVSVTTGDQQSAVEPLVLEVSAGPRLLSPEIGAILDNGCSFRDDNPIRWDFDWATVDGAEQYRIVVRGPSAIYDLVDAVVPESDYRFDRVGGYIINDNRLGWSWKVQALVDGAWGGWSVRRLFNVEPNNTDCP